MSEPRTALVTGASAGIGKAFAHLLAEQGYHLVLVARRRNLLEELGHELHARYGVRATVLVADLADIGAVRDLCNRLDELEIRVDFLVNNAGFATTGSFADASWHELHKQIQVMITALTELCHRLLGPMLEQGWGRIINLSSVAAFAPPTSSMLYTAIKSYVLNMSEALDMEVKKQGVHITALCPGFTQSEFHEVMGVRDAVARLPGIFWHEADEVAKAGYRAVMKGQPVCTPGLLNKTVAGSSRALPERLRYWLGKHVTMFDG